MSVKRKTVLIALTAVSFLLSASGAQAAETPKTQAVKTATAACKQFSLSMTINDSFLKLSQTAQTKTKMNEAIAAEGHALATALSGFKTAAKQDKKWKTVADKLNTVIHTDKADDYTKSFAAVLAACDALTPLLKK